MRKGLRDIRTEDQSFVEMTGIFVKFGEAKAPHHRFVPTALFKNLCFDGVIAAEHVWINDVGDLAGVEPEFGDVLQFNCKVYLYQRKAKGSRKKDYGLRTLRNPRLLHRRGQDDRECT